MRLLPDKQRRTSPWKNGGGVSREIAILPSGVGLDHFEWRLSLAKVTSAGPFSTFPAIDRILAVVEGGPLILNFQDGRRAVVEVDGPPFAFAGDQPVFGAPAATGVTDLNLMLRRGLRRGGLERHVLDGPIHIDSQASEAVIVAMNPVQLEGGAVLEPLDAVWLAPGESLDLLPLAVSAGVVIANIWAS